MIQNLSEKYKIIFQLKKNWKLQIINFSFKQTFIAAIDAIQIEAGRWDGEAPFDAPGETLHLQDGFYSAPILNLWRPGPGLGLLLFHA